MSKILKAELFGELAKLPTIDEAVVEQTLKASLQKFDKKIIVLDDDPTGTQTINNINVYTDWEQSSIDAGFVEDNDMFYILTNSRALPEQETSEIHQLIAYRIMKTFKKYHKDFIIISRSDSTLRGHFPTETDSLRRSFEGTERKPFDGEILMPFFKEGGRFTINDIHYVEEGKFLIPIGETEFAKSKRFKYSASDLKEYIEEKTHGKYRRDSVISISLEDLRAFKVDEIAKTLESITNFGKVVVNAIDYVDIKVFTIALLQAMAKGKQFLFRTAAGFPKIIGRVSDKAPLTREELVNHGNSHGGLIIVGSHMLRTTAQLQELRKNLRVNFIEFNHSLISKPSAMKIEVQRILRKAVEKIKPKKEDTKWTNCSNIHRTKILRSEVAGRFA